MHVKPEHHYNIKPSVF